MAVVELNLKDFNTIPAKLARNHEWSIIHYFVMVLDLPWHSSISRQTEINDLIHFFTLVMHFSNPTTKANLAAGFPSVHNTPTQKLSPTPNVKVHKTT